MSEELGFPDTCPPGDAQSADGVFYRLAARNLSVGDHPTSQDWQLPVHKRKGACAGDFDQCVCWSHSLFSDMQDLLDAAKTSDWVRKKSIARIELTPGMGLVDKTPSDIGDSHHDWWPSSKFGLESCVVVKESNG